VPPPKNEIRSGVRVVIKGFSFQFFEGRMLWGSLARKGPRPGVSADPSI